ncbi:plasminogen activator, urokinase b isoform X4 [Phycodurus eques]|uniref:plasminogen activator, urokinase b isoform X4 n=1 Tax=Phycodurus eques TaxID=693459 RepID=UPI002ACD3EB9|nr:plasminogen activator, urokinase b isoform X4 [Phycodurus eques]
MRLVVASLLLASAFGPPSAGGAGARRRDEGRRRRRTILSSSRSSGICQNGGTSVPALTTGRHLFCLCGDAFEGAFCQTGTCASSVARGATCGKTSGCFGNIATFPDAERPKHSRRRRPPRPHAPPQRPHLSRWHRPPDPQRPPDHVSSAPSSACVRVCVCVRAHICVFPCAWARACPSPASVGDVRAAFSQEADAYRRRYGFGGGVAPVGGGHLVAGQVQREGLPLRGEFDRQLLGPDRRSLLPRRIRRQRAALPGGAGQERPQPERRPRANVPRGQNHRAPRLQQPRRKLRQRRRAAEAEIQGRRSLRPGESRRPCGVPAGAGPEAPRAGLRVRDRGLRQGEARLVVPLAVPAAGPGGPAGRRRLSARRLLRRQDQRQHVVRGPARLDPGRL